MKKSLIFGAMLALSAPVFGQIRTGIPVIAVNISAPTMFHSVNGEFRSLAGIGIGLEFMIGGRLYFYGNITGDYLFSLDKHGDSVQAGFAVGLGYVIKNNQDLRGFSFAINIAPLGVGLDVRDVGTRMQTSSALYRFQLSFPLRFHYQESRAFQLSPFLILGAHTIGGSYNFMMSVGASIGLTY